MVTNNSMSDLNIELGLVSVIIPVYRSERFIAETLDSVLAQSYKKLEIIIINDASPDNSESIIQKYINKSSNIRYYEKVRAGNEPLNEPSKQSGKREQILDLYKQNGWAAVEQEFAKHGRVKRFVFQLYNMMPVGVQQMIRNIRDR